MNILNRVIKKYFNRDIDNVNKVQIDSSKVKLGDLFFAINKGNNYIKNALDNGASLVIGDNVASEFNGNSKVIKVENTVHTLQELAKEYRDNLKIKVIGITGSEGKTTTKDVVASILSEKYKVKKTQGNYNNQIGLPFTIFSLEEEDEIAVLEMGMSSFGEIERLSEICKPNYGIITNIGDSHLEFLIDRDNVFKAKTEMLKYIDEKNVIVSGDDFYLKHLLSIKVGEDKSNDYIIKDIVNTFGETEFTLNEERYKIPLNGTYNCFNCSFGIALGKKLNMSKTEIQNGLDKIVISNMRFEKIDKSNKVYINDAYNASPVSMKVSIDTFLGLPTEMEKVLFLGDILEMGKMEILYHEDILKFCLDRKEKMDIYVYGERMRKALDNLRTDKIKYISDKKEMIDILYPKKNVIVLLKGSRGMKLEEIIV